MASADFSTAPRVPDSPFPADFSGIRFVLDKDLFLELLDVLSAYDDLFELMDSGQPVARFLGMLNLRFANFVRELPHLDDAGS